MLQVDCSELSGDEKLALASEISDRLGGMAIALVKSDMVVIDDFREPPIDIETLRAIVSGFVSERRESHQYSLEVDGERLVVHSAEPATLSQKAENALPPNLKQCPMCSFITQYDEEYTVHVRSHYFGV